MAEKILKITIQLRRGTTAEWEENGTVVPANGEPCLDTTTGHLRFGDGVTYYRDLPDIATIQSNAIQALSTVVGTVNSGLVKQVNDIENLVGEIPSESQATSIIDYIDETQANEHANKAVLDGITAQNISQWNGIVGLPSVTAENNGSFLRVVHGAWAVEDLTDVSTEGM